MKCYLCKYYNENPVENECKKFGFYCFETYYNRDCPYIDEKYNITKIGNDIKKYL